MTKFKIVVVFDCIFVSPCSLIMFFFCVTACGNEILNIKLINDVVLPHERTLFRMEDETVYEENLRIAFWLIRGKNCVLQVLSKCRRGGMNKLDKLISESKKSFMEPNSHFVKWNETNEKHLEVQIDNFKYVEVPLWHIDLLGDKLHNFKNKQKKTKTHNYEVRQCPGLSNIVAK